MMATVHILMLTAHAHKISGREITVKQVLRELRVFTISAKQMIYSSNMQRWILVLTVHILMLTAHAHMIIGREITVKYLPKQCSSECVSLQLYAMKGSVRMVVLAHILIQTAHAQWGGKDLNAKQVQCE